MYIHDEDWEYIFSKYPGLQGDLAKCANYNELKHLRNEINQNYNDAKRKSWIANRIKELTQFN
jgi:hypothetical protein